MENIKNRFSLTKLIQRLISIAFVLALCTPAFQFLFLGEKLESCLAKTFSIVSLYFFADIGSELLSNLAKAIWRKN